MGNADGENLRLIQTTSDEKSVSKGAIMEGEQDHYGRILLVVWG